MVYMDSLIVRLDRVNSWRILIVLPRISTTEFQQVAPLPSLVQPLLQFIGAGIPPGVGRLTAGPVLSVHLLLSVIAESQEPVTISSLV